MTLDHAIHKRAVNAAWRTAARVAVGPYSRTSEYEANTLLAAHETVKDALACVAIESKRQDDYEFNWLAFVITPVLVSFFAYVLVRI